MNMLTLRMHCSRQNVPRQVAVTPVAAWERRGLFMDPVVRLKQPNSYNKCLDCAFLQTTDMLKFYILTTLYLRTGWVLAQKPPLIHCKMQQHGFIFFFLNQGNQLPQNDQVKSILALTTNSSTLDFSSVMSGLGLGLDTRLVATHTARRFPYILYSRCWHTHQIKSRIFI